MADTITLEGFTAEFESTFDIDDPVRLEGFNAEFDAIFPLDFPVSLEGFNAEYDADFDIDTPSRLEGFNAEFDVDLFSDPATPTVTLEGVSLEFDGDFPLYDRMALEGLTAELDAPFNLSHKVVVEGVTTEFDGAFNLVPRSMVEGVSTEFYGEGFVYDYSMPEITSFGTINGEQHTLGETDIEINWPSVTNTVAASGEFLGNATGNGVTFPILGINISSTGSSYETGQVMEVTGYAGIDTTLTESASIGDTIINITAGSPAIDSAIELWGQTQKEFAQVKSVDGLEITLHLPLQHNHRDVLSTVKGVSVTEMTESTDYTIDRTNGSITTIAGQFTSPRDIFIRYSTESADIDHYELYMQPGDHLLPDGVTKSELVDHVATVAITTNINQALNQYVRRQSQHDAGETYTFYFLSVDSKGSPSLARALAIDTIPPILVGMGNVTTVLNENILTWTAMDGANIDGVNIYRCIGPWNSAESTKINTSLITEETFTDGVSNLTNRVSEGVAEFPYPGSNMQYRAEVVDSSAPNWDTGTQNETTGQSEVLIATVSPSYTPPTIPPFV